MNRLPQIWCRSIGRPLLYNNLQKTRLCVLKNFRQNRKNRSKTPLFWGVCWRSPRTSLQRKILLVHIHSILKSTCQNTIARKKLIARSQKQGTSYRSALTHFFIKENPVFCATLGNESFKWKTKTTKVSNFDVIYVCKISARSVNLEIGKVPF